MATDYTDRLRTLPLFAALNEADLQEVNQIVRLSRRSAGEIIFREGDDSRQLYIIESGQVSVFRRDPAGVEVIVRLLGPGRFFGETGLLSNAHRNATIQTNMDTTFFVVENRGFETLLHLPSVRKQLEAAAHRRSASMPRFEWQLPDEAAVAVSNRNTIPLIFESAPRLFAWGGLAVILFALSFVSFPNLVPTAVPWMLRIAGFVLFVLTWTYNIFDWTNDVLVVTNQRVVLLERFGWIRETRQELPIAAIQGVTLAHSGLLQTVLNVTNISVATIGSKLVFTHIRNGPFMQERILDQHTLAQQGAQRQEMESIRQELLRALRPSLPPEAAEPAPARAAAPAAASQEPEARKPPVWREWLRKLGPQLRLEKDGQIIWHKHWLLLAWRLAFPAFLLTVGVVLCALLLGVPADNAWAQRFSAGLRLIPGGMFVLAALVLGWWEYAIWDGDLYILADNRIIDIERRPLGLKETRRESNVERIQDIDVDIPNPLARIFDLGDVFIKTGAAGSDLTFHSVPHPHDVQRDIFHRLATALRQEQEQQRRQRAEEMTKWLSAYSQVTAQIKN